MDQVSIKQTKEFLRSNIARGIQTGTKGVDRNVQHEKGKGAILGYAVITKGKLNDQDVRDWEMDDISLDKVIELGNQSKVGLKSRFGHPNMSGEALGTFLGRAKNFVKDGDVVRANLFFDETAYKTPNGDLANYVMDLAENDPNAFGSSLVFDCDFEYRVEKDGTKKKDPATGKELPALVRFKKLFSSDVVDDPTATSGMFGKFFNSSVELSAKATEFLDKLLNNPDALESVIMFLERYRTNRDDIDQTQTKKPKEVSQMEIKDLTVEMLTKERPDLLESARNEAVKSERTRILAIVKAEHTEFKGMGMETIVEDAIEKGNTVDAALSTIKGKRLADIEAKSNKAPGADSPEATKAKPSHLDKAKEYQKEHKCSIAEALRATAENREKK